MAEKFLWKNMLRAECKKYYCGSNRNMFFWNVLLDQRSRPIEYFRILNEFFDNNKHLLSTKNELIDIESSW